MSGIFSFDFLMYDIELNKVTIYLTIKIFWLRGDSTTLYKLWFLCCKNCVNRFYHKFILKGHLSGYSKLKLIKDTYEYGLITGQLHGYLIWFTQFPHFSLRWLIPRRGRRSLNFKGSEIIAYLFQTLSRQPLDVEILLNPQVDGQIFNRYPSLVKNDTWQIQRFYAYNKLIQICSILWWLWYYDYD